MKISVGLLLATGLVSILCACSGSNGGGGGSPAPDDNNKGYGPQPNVAVQSISNHMQFASSISTDQISALNETISTLHALPLAKSFTATNLQTMMELSDMTPASLQNWLETRVTYIVDQDFSLDSNVSLEATAVQFPNVGQIPDPIKISQQQQNNARTSDSSNATVVMLNVGSAAYFYGKTEGKIADVNIPGVGVVPMKSPRAGLLQVGPGLFSFMGSIDGIQVQNILSDIFRAGTLFHEARHSDGHGLTLGFFHDICPADRDYAGLSACDAAANGPYTVGAQMMKNLMDSCGANCTALTQKVLQILYADQADRTLSDSEMPNASVGAKAGTNWDDAPESVN